MHVFPRKQQIRKQNEPQRHTNHIAVSRRVQRRWGKPVPRTVRSEDCKHCDFESTHAAFWPERSRDLAYCFLSRTIDHQSITEDCRVGMGVAFHSYSISLCPLLPFWRLHSKYSYLIKALQKEAGTPIFSFLHAALSFILD